MYNKLYDYQIYNFKQNKYKGHDFHIVPLSGYPLFISMFIFCFLYNFILYMNGLTGLFDKILCVLSLVMIVITIFMWLDDIIIESYQYNNHSDRVRAGIRLGMVLFIVSEIMFFFSFFWGYFHFALSPNMFIGCVWPPENLPLFLNIGIPFYNTVLLVTSGAFLTGAHYELLYSEITNTLKFTRARLYWSIIWGLIFVFCQLYEYINLPFNINDSVYGSIFFMLTGFHGFHVIIGLCMLISVAYHLLNGVYNYKQHTGFECAAWYWHFVDVVWLFLFICVYIWGYNWNIVYNLFGIG